MTNTLNIPYLSQVDDPGARQFANDCGPASVAMVLAAFDKLEGNTINSLYKETGNKKDSYTSYGQLAALLRKRGISTQRKINMQRGEIFEILQQGKPVIVLVDYEYFQPLKPESKFRDQHFFVVVGFDIESVIVNDPLWRGEGGKSWRIPWAVFDEAWDEANPERSALIINNSLFDKKVEDSDNDNGFTEYVITAWGLNVRSRPFKPNRIVGGVYGGDHVRVYETQWNTDSDQLWGRIGEDQWIAIKYKGRTYAKKG